VIEAEANLGGLHLRREEKGYLREEHENMKMRRRKEEDSEIYGTDVKCCTKKMLRFCRKGGTI